MKLIIDSDGRAATLLPGSSPPPALLACLPSIEGPRHWLKGGGLKFVASRANVDLLTASIPGIAVSRASGDAGETSRVQRTPRTYLQKTAPYDHQRAALEKARTRSAFALLMEQGTGKTKVAIDRAGELWAEGKIDAVLVVAKKGVHRQWIESQLPEHFGGERSGAFWKGDKFSGDLSGRGLVWRAINYDAAKAGRGKAACEAFIREHKGRLLIIADETQEIKNPSSERHKALELFKAQSRSPYRLALTGTPIAKDLTDEWAQLRWLNDEIIGIRYLTAFRRDYCIMGGFEGREVVGHKNLERFKALAAPATFRATKNDLGIIPKAYRRWTFDLAPEQARIVSALKRDLIARIDSGEIVEARTGATALLRIQQASNGFAVDENGELQWLKANARLIALKEVLEAHPGKTIIWARFRADFACIASELKALGETFAEYHGGTTDAERAKAIESFLSEGGARIFLSNPQAGGTGLNLQGECRHAIYYSNSFSAIDRWQSEDRIHRIGTKGAVVYTDLVAKGAIDGMILSNLKRKKGISDLALGEIRSSLDESL